MKYVEVDTAKQIYLESTSTELSYDYFKTHIDSLAVEREPVAMDALEECIKVVPFIYQIAADHGRQGAIEKMTQYKKAKQQLEALKARSG